MILLTQFGAGLVQNVSRDFLKLIILLPIGLLIDFAIKAIIKRRKMKDDEKDKKQNRKEVGKN